MLSVSITDVKNFMAHLLSRETFDLFYLVEASFKKEISYHIDGHLNTDFFDTDSERRERNIVSGKRCALCFFDHPGETSSSRCKIILALPKANGCFSHKGEPLFFSRGVY